MKNITKLLIVLYLFVFVNGRLSAQYNEMWTPVKPMYSFYNYFIGSENLDGDPQKELVFLSCNTVSRSSSYIYVIDGKTGAIEWNSGYWTMIFATTDRYGSFTDNASWGPKLVDVNNDGIFEILFFGSKLVSDDDSWHIFSSLSTVQTQNLIINSSLNVEQNYPNPFSENTTIQFKVESNALVSIKVYDINGNELETILNEQLIPDVYKYDLKGSNLKSGMYLYQVKIGNEVSSKKMIKL